jgi:hypothetical protein
MAHFCFNRQQYSFGYRTGRLDIVGYWHLVCIGILW